jgi:hypothetical protein
MPSLLRPVTRLVFALRFCASKPLAPYRDWTNQASDTQLLPSGRHFAWRSPTDDYDFASARASVYAVSVRVKQRISDTPRAQGFAVLSGLPLRFR